MGRTFWQKLRDSTWWLEQSAHGWMGGGISLTAQAAMRATGGGEPSQIIVGIGCAAALMTLYELIQNVGDSDNDYLDSFADWSFGTLGGVLVTIPAMVGVMA